MSSTIFYRFRSQRDTNRILFDGTGLTVFDLKREIIHENKLGDGTHFQLRLYNPDTNDEYDDDSQVIPRSSSVVARRSPAVRAFSANGGGMSKGSSASLGNAARYVTGKPRVLQKKQSSGITSNGSGKVNGVTEEERIANMFADQENQWEQTQQEMSSATPVFYKSQNNGPNSGENEGLPPPGYMCYRCGARDHWIKNCPTNSDPNFEGKRIRRTTGIPKKFLKSVEIDPNNITAEEMAQRKIMVTDDGKFVVQVADQQSWEDYQRKQQNRYMNGADAKWRKGYFADLPDNLKCSITGGLLRDPVRTSKCCNKLFSKMAIEDALLESDFVCPSCNTPGILLDSLVEDEQVQKEVESFLQKKESEKESTENASKRENEQQEIGSDKNVKKPKIDPPIKAPNLPLPPVPFGMPPFPMFPGPLPFLSQPPPQQSSTSHHIEKK
ncbi:hypothetical protein HG535_0C05360 [Zygotorulaspora mrakii]|uniref:DWNN domain-containing protein n=1 Tax=Zygotorulaspora mrakii TaxID=42260 RepID=A0A7H9B345_ZYGMR|nr:uncharacterized protein HG535_0C05360 [Zygotorulaspora mrakii]QLG72182.1 hypothetical protein HG535_0C05360 [Zygotorulaspora mrakii]